MLPVDAAMSPCSKLTTGAVAAHELYNGINGVDAPDASTALPPCDHWDNEAHLPLRAGGATIHLHAVTPRVPSSNVSSASSLTDLAGLRNISRPTSPFPSRPRSGSSDASVIDLMATQVEAIIAQQQLGPAHFGQTLHMCRELLAYGQHCPELLTQLVVCADLNLPLYSLLSGDTATFDLLDQHGLALSVSNHFVFQVYAAIPGAESPAVCDYYDSEIAYYVRRNDVDELDVPRHVLAFVNALCERDDARYLVYVCQSARIAAQCALLAGDIALAARAMRELTFTRRAIIAPPSPSGSSQAS